MTPKAKAEEFINTYGGYFEDVIDVLAVIALSSDNEEYWTEVIAEAMIIEEQRIEILSKAFLQTFEYMSQGVKKWMYKNPEKADKAVSEWMEHLHGLYDNTTNK